MKSVIQEYTFTPASKTIRFDSFATIELSKILLIVNTTSNTVIYNFACDGLGGTVATNILTLETSLTGQSSSDELLIYYELGEDKIAYNSIRRKLCQA